MNLENQATHMSAQTLEQLSAWMDGELDSAELDRLLDKLPAPNAGAHCYASVHSYLTIGEIMRSPATEKASTLSFLSTLSARIAQEPPLQALSAVDQPLAGEVAVPVVSAAVAVPSVQEAANQSVFRWKMVAGFASVAAVAMVGWNSLALLSGPAGKGQLASAPAGVTQLASATNPNAQGLVQMPVTVGQNASIMLRDPRIDELLAARGQIGGTANLQMPASFLRNATFNAEKKSGGCPDRASRLC